MPCLPIFIFIKCFTFFFFQNVFFSNKKVEKRRNKKKPVGRPAHVHMVEYLYMGGEGLTPHTWGGRKQKETEATTFVLSCSDFFSITFFFMFLSSCLHIISYLSMSGHHVSVPSSGSVPYRVDE